MPDNEDGESADSEESRPPPDADPDEVAAWMDEDWGETLADAVAEYNDKADE